MWNGNSELWSCLETNSVSCCMVCLAVDLTTESKCVFYLSILFTKDIDVNLTESSLILLKINEAVFLNHRVTCLRCSACSWRLLWTSSRSTGRTCRTGSSSCSLSCWRRWGQICWAPSRPKSRRPWISQGVDSNQAGPSRSQVTGQRLDSIGPVYH